MDIKFKIEAVAEDGQVFSSPGAGEFPININQTEYYSITGADRNEIMLKAIAMVSMITAAAANDTEFPELFKPENETISLPNPFFKV